MDGFKAGAGTIMFFEDHSVVRDMQAAAPLYADKFPIWADQTNAMHQYIIWTALASIDVGANLQHYNPIIDKKLVAVIKAHLREIPEFKVEATTDKFHF